MRTKIIISLFAGSLIAVQAHAQWTVTNLHPTGASLSVAYGVSGANQVGYARVGGIDRASLWSGTAASWVDLHPAGARSSVAYGVSGANQVGVAWVGGRDRASLWSGTAASWVDLHALLPAGLFSQSVARSITTDGDLIHIAALAAARRRRKK